MFIPLSSFISSYIYIITLKLEIGIMLYCFECDESKFILYFSTNEPHKNVF